LAFSLRYSRFVRVNVDKEILTNSCSWKDSAWWYKHLLF